MMIKIKGGENMIMTDRMWDELTLIQIILESENPDKIKVQEALAVLKRVLA